MSIVTHKHKLINLSNGVYVIEKFVFFNDEFNVTRKLALIVSETNVSRPPKQDIESLLTLELVLTNAPK